MKKNITILITGVVLSFCFIIFYKGLNNPNTYAPKTSIKKDIPIFNAVDFFSKKTVSSDEIFKDNTYYIVNIWASWCVPCRVEHPLLIHLLAENDEITYEAYVSEQNLLMDDSEDPIKHPLIEEIFSGKKGSSYFKPSN